MKLSEKIKKIYFSFSEGNRKHEWRDVPER